MKKEFVMKLFKYTLILGTSALLFSNVANAIFTAEHRTFSGNGDPKVEALVKKCQTIEDERYGYDVQHGKFYDKIKEGKTKYHHVDESPELKQMEEKMKSLEAQLRSLHCI